METSKAERCIWDDCLWCVACQRCGAAASAPCGCPGSVRVHRHDRASITAQTAFAVVGAARGSLVGFIRTSDVVAATMRQRRDGVVRAQVTSTRTVGMPKLPTAWLLRGTPLSSL